MARFKVKDIPKNQRISTDELKRIRGGAGYIKFDGINYSGPLLQVSIDPKDKDHDKWSDIL